MNETTKKTIAKLLLDLAHRMCGNAGLAIMAALLSNGPMRDEDLSAVTGMNVLTIRGIVSSFTSAGLVTYFEQRARTNWIDYYFFIDEISVRAALKERFLKMIDLVTSFLQLVDDREVKFCNNCGMFYKMEETLLDGGNFVCPVCGQPVQEVEELVEKLNNHLSDVIKKLREYWKYL